MRRRGALWAGLGSLAFAGTSCSFSFGMPRGGTEQGEQIFTLWQVFTIAGLAVAALVYGLIGWSLFRYRRRRGEPDEALGHQFHANIPLEIVYTAVPVIMVVALFAISVRGEGRVTALAPDPAVTLHAEAFAWGWRFSYGDDGPVVLSAPSGQGVAGPTIQLPRGLTTRVVLTSQDVIHALWVPGFLFKRDAIPGRVSEFDLTPTQDGSYQGVCAEFCGLNHAYMTFTVQVVEPAAFDTWLAHDALVGTTP